MRGRRFILLCVLGTAGCEDRDPMQVQQRYGTYRESTFFADGRAMRPRVEGTVAREEARVEPSGRQADGSWRTAVPQPLTRALLEEGQEHFEVHCAACHGLLGNGESAVAEKMPLRRPPSLLQGKPAGFIYTAISEGYGLMPSYGDRLKPAQRWAVVAYVEVLTLSQSAPLAAAPEDERERLLREAP